MLSISIRDGPLEGSGSSNVECGSPERLPRLPVYALGAKYDSYILMDYSFRHMGKYNSEVPDIPNVD